ncbi:MAG: DMT family transporter [Pseudomonadota bacterium]
MEWLWIPISLGAGLMQAVRTAAQKAINAHLSTWMTTYVRSLFGLPVMAVYLWIVVSFEGLGVPVLHAEYLFHCAMTAITQVVATYLLILLFQRANFAVGTMLTKTDIMQAAIIGSILFSEAISAIGWVAIGLTLVGVILISARQLRGALTGGGGLGRLLGARATLLGLGSGFGFCLSYLFLREASLSMEDGSTVYRGAWSVVVVTTMQVVTLGLWLLARERAEFAKLPGLIRPCLFIGLTSALGSIGWFTAMAMQNASYVKAVGQVEVVFTILISTLYFRERITTAEYAGIATIVAAVLLFIF